MHGDVAFNSFLKNCTIHHTYSRALAVHGTNRLNISYNVGYHAMGHMFFIEDGAEVRAAEACRARGSWASARTQVHARRTCDQLSCLQIGNVFDGNLGFATLVSNALLNTDTTPATFWVGVLPKLFLGHQPDRLC
jgi:hypothetical protein